MEASISHICTNRLVAVANIVDLKFAQQTSSNGLCVTIGEKNVRGGAACRGEVKKRERGRRGRKEEQERWRRGRGYTFSDSMVIFGVS